MSTLPDVTKAVPMTAPQIDALIQATKIAGAFATPVIRRDGRTDEVGIYAGGQLAGTVYKPVDGGLAIWTLKGQRRVSDPTEAVRIITATARRR